MRLSHCRVLAVFAVVALFATPAFAATHFISIFGSAYAPNSLMINTGDTVTWINNDILPHTVTSGSPCSANGLFNSGVMDPEVMFSHTFLSVGSFPYFCAFHCLAGMRGTIVVTQPVPVATTTWGAIKALYAAQQR